MSSQMPKTRLSRTTIYGRWMKASDSLHAARLADDEKAIVRHALRVAQLSFAMAEYDRGAAARASWRKVGMSHVEYAAKVKG